MKLSPYKNPAGPRAPNLNKNKITLNKLLILHGEVPAILNRVMIEGLLGHGKVKKGRAVEARSGATEP